MPAEPVFLDTNGWLALLNASDSLHSVASLTWTAIVARGSRLVVTDWIIAETGNGLARSRERGRFVSAVHLLRSSPRVEIVDVAPPLWERSLDLYARRSDKTWGLIDCASFLVMEDQGISRAFTNDRHFEQAGFTNLLPGPG